MKSAPGASASVQRERVLLALYAGLLVSWSYFFSNTYIEGLYSSRIELFSDIFIPLATLFLHLLLLKFVWFWLYCTAAAIDLIVKIGIATHHGYFSDNIDIHVFLSNFAEGAQVAGFVAELIPISLAITGLAVLVTECYLASRLSGRIGNRFLLGLGVAVAVMAPLGLVKVPPRQASEELHYAKAIKVHGYYAAVAYDLLFGGRYPPQEQLIARLGARQAESPVVFLPKLTLPVRSTDNLLAIQVESLDFDVIGFTLQGRPVTPFLNSLRDRSLFLKLKSYHLAAAGSAGSDFQFLTGLIPLDNYPVYRLRGVDYSSALPRVFEGAGVSSLAFHGNSRAFFGRGRAFEEMGFERFYDAEDLGEPDTSWGLSDELFWTATGNVIEEHLDERRFYFAITLTSHGPFDFVQHRVFEGGGLTTRYLNAINYTDSQLEDFLRSLDGSYLVVIYGDHTSGVRDTDYRSAGEAGEYIPAFVFRMADGAIERPGVPHQSEFLSGALDIRSLYHLVREHFPGK